MSNQLTGVVEIDEFLSAERIDLSYFSVWLSKEYRVYQELYCDETEFSDLSFGLIDANGKFCLALVSRDIDRDGLVTLSNWGAPVLIVCQPGFALSKAFQKEFVGRFRTHSSNHNIVLWDAMFGGVISPLAMTFLTNDTDFKVAVTPRIEDVLDLGDSEVELRQGLRKSYRNLVNAGERTWQIGEYSGSESERSRFDEFMQLHQEAAGRITRSSASWEYQWDRVKSGISWIMEARDEGGLVAASLFDIHGSTWDYSVSAAKRELFNNPVNHSLVWRAILRAKAQGARWFYFGESAWGGHEAADPKLLSIMKFKRGFGGQSQMKLELKIGTNS
tara:strand:+ start:4479 stop:5474 length:996 start_codon:yes stop_codon:yes gene_type:complete